jgi:hypothetical protein
LGLKTSKKNFEELLVCLGVKKGYCCHLSWLTFWLSKAPHIVVNMYEMIIIINLGGQQKLQNILQCFIDIIG